MRSGALKSSSELQQTSPAKSPLGCSTWQCPIMSALGHPGRFTTRKFTNKNQMIPVEEAPASYWRTNDAEDLAFNEAGPQPPTHISCYNLHDTLNRGELRKFLSASCICWRSQLGVRNVGWAGDAYRFGIYSTRRCRSPKLSSWFPMVAAWISGSASNLEPRSREPERGSAVESLLR